MLFLLLCQSMDSALGKVDRNSMTQQSLMEILVSEWKEQSNFQASNGDFFDATKWRGIKCDIEDNIVSVSWIDWFWARNEGGTLDLQWLPCTVTRFAVTGSRLEGTVDMISLPRNLEYLFLDRNDLYGTIDIPSAPNPIKKLILYENHFHGTLNLLCIPPHAEVIQLNNNKFHGCVVIGNLPPSLRDLCLRENDFKGIAYRNEGDQGDSRIEFNIK